MNAGAHLRDKLALAWPRQGLTGVNTHGGTLARRLQPASGPLGWLLGFVCALQSPMSLTLFLRTFDLVNWLGPRPAIAEGDPTAESCVHLFVGKAVEGGRPAIQPLTSDEVAWLDPAGQTRQRPTTTQLSAEAIGCLGHRHVVQEAFGGGRPDGGGRSPRVHTSVW